MSSLPTPESVDASNLHLPPSSKQDTLKVLAVLSHPSHPLFNRCAHAAVSNFKTASALRRSPIALATIARGIQALPDGLSPRQASIAASFLASLLCQIITTDHHTTHLDPSAPVRVAFPRSLPDPQGTILRLVCHGMVCRDAAASVAPQEIDDLDLAEVTPLRIAAEHGSWEELQQWARCPRYLTMAALTDLSHSVSGPDLRQVVSALLLENDHASTVREELASWMVRAVVEWPQVNWLLHRLMTTVAWPDSVTGVMQKTLLQPPMEPVLLSLGSRWLERLRCSTTENEERLVMRRDTAAVEFFGNLLRNLSGAPRLAPCFLLSIADAVLHILEGPTFILPPPEVPGGARSPAAALSSVYSPGSTDAAGSSINLQWQQPQQPQKLKPAVRGKADRIRGLLESLGDAQRSVLQAFKDLAQHVQEGPEVLQEVVHSGLAARMVAALLRIRGDNQSVQTTSQLLVAPLAQMLFTITEATADLRHQLGLQVLEMLESVPALLDMLLQADELEVDGDWALFFARMLPPSASSESVQRILQHVVLPVLNLRTETWPDTGLKFTAACCLITCHAAVPLLCSAGTGQVQTTLKCVQECLQDARYTVLLSPAAECIMALAESTTWEQPRQDALAGQKELLWRIGQVVDQQAAGSDRAWQHVSIATDHKMSGVQLKQLYSVLRRQGYKGQALEWLEEQVRGSNPHCKELFGAVGAACTFLSSLLGHFATGDPVSLPGSELCRRGDFLPAAVRSAGSIAVHWPTPRTACWPVCALMACLLTWARLEDGDWLPAWSLVHGEIQGAVSACVDPLQPELVQMAGLGWVAAMLSGCTLGEARRLLEESSIWRAISDLTRHDSWDWKSAVGRMLISVGGGIMGAAVKAGLLQAALEVCEMPMEGGEIEDGAKEVCDCFSEVEERGVPGLLLGISICLGLYRRSIAARGVDWEVRMPGQWEGLDAALQQEWWALLREWVPQVAHDLGADLEAAVRVRSGSAGGPRAAQEGVGAAAAAEGVGQGSGSGRADGEAPLQTQQQQQEQQAPPTPPPVPVPGLETGVSESEGLGNGTGALAPEGSTLQGQHMSSGGPGHEWGVQGHSGEPAEGAGEVRQCAACGLQSEPLQLCSGCQRVRYCSVDCQRGHWKQHKRACKAARAAAGQPAP